MLKDYIYSLFFKLLRQKKLPNQWKIAKIISFRKLGKANFTEPSAFHPISLLSSLSKAIEAVIAEKIAYLTEKFYPVPSNHYGALKRKLIINVLFTI